MENKLAIYKFYLDYGRNGEIEGIFLANPNHVKILIDSELTVNFGEVLGRFSSVTSKITDKMLSFITDNEEAVNMFEHYNLSSGFNPFYYPVIIDYDTIEYEDLDLYEIVEIIEKKINNNH